MGWEDRPYYRDRSTGPTNPLMWLLSGDVPLFTVFGIRVRAHASLVVTVVLVLVFGLGPGFTWQDRVQSMAILFITVLLHEFGHCFAARWVGGEANDILMHPLGGLAMASPPHRPLPTFLTVAGGPAVNVLICLFCGGILYSLTGWLPWNPFRFYPIGAFDSWVNLYRYAAWFYQVSYMLLCFNLLPIFPLDGGQMLQAILWPKFGYYKSMLFACNTGMVGAILGGMIALATVNLMLAILAFFGFLTCLNMRRALIANGPEEYADSTNYSAAYDIDPGRTRKKTNGWMARRRASRQRKLADEERSERATIDQILAKVSSQGMGSLSAKEKRALAQATENQRRRDVELSRLRRT